MNVRFQTADKGIKYAAKIIIGEQSVLKLLKFDPEVQRVIIGAIFEGGASSVYAHTDVPVSVATIPSEKSRNVGHIRSDCLSDVLSGALPKDGSKDVSVLLAVQKANQLTACATAVARTLPLFSKKSDRKTGGVCYVDFHVEDGSKVDYAELQRICDGTRLCARLVDTPAGELSTDAYVDEVKQVAAELKNVEVKIIRGEELKNGGFGGLWGVGKAAPFPPSLVVLTYTPPKASTDKVVAFVGKGICFDTGGLSIKGSTNMCQMKSDMGGSAAMLGAFKVLVESGHTGKVHALLCIAENSVDSASTRPDDILQMYSGKSVEINNTDAEGRLVLADGVAYATKDLKPTHMIDMATLTGAQMVCTGMKHAAVMSNSASLEQLAIQSGRDSGDWTFPILYAPEILKKEFKSDVADMKNSVKSRMNAQSSCAGHFIEDHINPEWKGEWLHCDIAGPSFSGERATGFGVALLVDMVRKIN